MWPSSKWSLSLVLASFYKPVAQHLWNLAVMGQGRMGTDDSADSWGCSPSVGGRWRLMPEHANIRWTDNGSLMVSHWDTILHGFWSVLPFLWFAWFQNNADLLCIIWEKFIQVLVYCQMPPRFGTVSLPNSWNPVCCAVTVAYKLLRKCK